MLGQKYEEIRAKIKLSALKAKEKFQNIKITLQLKLWNVYPSIQPSFIESLICQTLLQTPEKQQQKS